MPLPGFITKLFAGKAGDIIASVGGVIDNLTLSKEEKLKFEAALLEATNKHMEVMAALGQSELDAHLKDIDSARQMQIAALQNQDVFSKRFIYYLTAGIIILTFTFDFCLFWVQYPERNHDLVNMVVGILNGSCLVAIMNFFYGSTKGSEKKTEALERMAQK